MRLEGTAARTSHRPRWRQEMPGPVAASSFATAEVSIATLPPNRHARIPHKAMSVPTPANAQAQIRLWSGKPHTGSTTNGYASSEARLPRLLAAYSRYGSDCDAHLVMENQRCNNGALAEATTNGAPTRADSKARSQMTGVPWVGGCDSEGIVIGSVRVASTRSVACRPTCAGRVSREIRCAYP